MTKKPDGIGETEALLRKVVQVPKKEVDQLEAKRRRKKSATKRKK